jgi:hypothetical protein
LRLRYEGFRAGGVGCAVSVVGVRSVSLALGECACAWPGAVLVRRVRLV